MARVLRTGGCCCSNDTGGSYLLAARIRAARCADASSPAASGRVAGRDLPDGYHPGRVDAEGPAGVGVFEPGERTRAASRRVLECRGRVGDGTDHVELLAGA